MKAVLMRRHQTMADVVPITTLLAILICIGYCSDTAGGTGVVGSGDLQSIPVTLGSDVSVQHSSEEEETIPKLDSSTALVQQPKEEDPKRLDGQQTQVQKQASESEASQPLPDTPAQGGNPSPQTSTLDALSDPQKPLVLEQLNAEVPHPAQETTNTSPEGHTKQTQVSAGQESQEVVQQKESPGGASSLEGQLPNPPETLVSGISGGTLSGLNPSDALGLVSKLPPLGGHDGSQLEASLVGQATALAVGQGGLIPPAQSFAKTLQTGGATSGEGAEERVPAESTAEPGAAPTQPGSQTSKTGYTAPDPQTPSPGDTDFKNTPLAPLTEDGSKTTETAIQPPTQNGAIISATSVTSAVTPGTTAPLPGTAPTPPSQTAPQQQVITPVSQYTPPEPSTSTQAKAGTTDSHTTGQGPSPPAGASQASADVTVQQGPTPEEKKEQQKEVTGITPQAPRQEGQQQKGQTPQGPPPLGSTSGATPGKDNTRETAKTPPTGTDTNNNNNNITIPKIAVNETIISATVVPSAIPAVLVCSVVFLYLSRR